MKTQYYTACSLDGFIATEDHSLEWLFQLGDIHDTGYPDFIKEVGALAMGSSTYEWMVRHVIRPGTESGAPWPYSQPTWVFSTRSLQSVTPKRKPPAVPGDSQSLTVPGVGRKTPSGEPLNVQPRGS